MDSQTVRTALGKLQADPDSKSDWQALRAAAKEATGDLPLADFIALCESARSKHAARGEWSAVADILDVESMAARGTPEEARLLAQHAEVLVNQLFADELAAAVYTRMLEIDESDARATALLAESEERRGKHQELGASYAAEAEGASDDVYRSSMLMRSAEMRVRYGGSDSADAAAEQLEQAVRLDPTNVTAGRMLEELYRRGARWEELARVLERLADRSEEPGTRVTAGVRLARLYKLKLDDLERSARAYARVLRDAPDHAEAMEFLAEFYSSRERWDDLVAMFEGELKHKDMTSAQHLGGMLQIAMLHWKERERPQDAEPWFDRIRKINPAHEGMLGFYREYSAGMDDTTTLIDVLQGAQRAFKDDAKKRAEIAAEIAQLAEGQENAAKAIEQYKSVLRQDPDNTQAREALVRLYKNTQSYNALVELLRQQLERTPAEEYQIRLTILREVATVYRQYVKSDTALVSVLNQIVQLDEKLDAQDAGEIRELVNLYEKLGRFRELLTHQQILAGIVPDREEKKTLYREIARRWLDQFSNVQNATEAYAELYKLAPDDLEARERLVELYRKRRAWPALYEMYESELAGQEGAARLPLMKEMAQLAAERLNRGEDAVRLYKEILALEPERVEILDALERHAERVKDWATLAEALEQRATIAPDDAAKLNVLTKLGTVYSEQLEDAPRTVSAWKRVLEIQPGHNRALRVLRDSYLQAGDYDGLEQLYASQNDWEGLAEVFSSGADRAKEDDTKIELSYRAAAVYEQKLSAPDRAFRSYERVLSVAPNDSRAARALIPLYEQDEKWARLPPLYEVLVGQVEGEEEKLELLKKLAEIAASRLSDKSAAAMYARRAYDAAPDNKEILDLFEQASGVADAWDAFVEALEGRLSDVPASIAAPPVEAEVNRRKKKKKKDKDSEPTPSSADEAAPERRMLRLKLAKVYAVQLGQTDRAVQTYKQQLDKDPRDAEAAGELETILRRDNRRDDLRWLLELRVEHAGSTYDKARILSDWATLEEEVFESPDQAAALYRRVLELDSSDRNALTALPRLLLAAGDAEGAAQVIEQHRDQLSGTERAARDLELAELYASRLERPKDALAAVERALELGGDQGLIMGLLERLSQTKATRARAAEVLAEQYANTGEARHEVQALETMLEQASEPARELELFQRLISVQEEKLGAYSSALDITLRALSKHPTELGLWDRAESLATQAGRPTELSEAYRDLLRRELPAEFEIELCERAARLHEDRLGDPIGATPYLERVLARSPGNETAFTRLKDILTAAERWSELEALYDKASIATDDETRRIDMLVEVALICEEIIEDPPKAAKYYERILAIDPVHDASVRALDRLYVRLGRNSDLAGLLERRLDVAVGEDLLDLKLRLAKLDIELHHPEKAIGYVEDVLRERTNDYAARELGERLLEIGSLRMRAARMLEQVYEARDEIRDLVRVLTVRLEVDAGSSEPLTDEERRDILRRVATLRDERLHDDPGALAALSELIPLDPLDADARRRLLEVGGRENAHQRVAEVLEKAADKADTPGMQGEILTQVATIYEGQLADRARAEKVYRRVLKLDPDDAELVLPASRALERIYQADGEHKKLAEMLEIQVKLEQSTTVRAELLARLGELSESLLDDKQAAIAAWKARAEELPSDDRALKSLDRLYEQTGAWRDLVSVLERRKENTEDREERGRLMARAAQILWKQIGAVEEAIDAYRSLVDDYGASSESLGALEALFEAASRYEDLADAYEQHLEIATMDSERLELMSKLGDLRRTQLGEVDSALDVYRRALSLDAQHAPSRAALETLLTSGEQSSRRVAAEILRPIYEVDGNHEKLLKTLEIEVETTDDPALKLERLEQAMNVAEGPLGDPGRAYGYAERLARQAAGNSELSPYLAHLDRLAAPTNRQAEYTKLLCEVVPDIFDGDVQLAVTLKIAELARHQLADRELARQYYQKALELRPDDRAALVALESLYEETGDAQNLLEVIEKRIDAADSDDEKKQLMFRKARLLGEVLEDRKRAVEAYEAILDMRLEPAAIEALERLYPTLELWSELAQLYQRQLDENVGDAALLHVQIARVAAQRLSDVPRAFDELELSLEIRPQYDEAIRELERLLADGPDPEVRARAASLLEPVYLARADYAHVLKTLEARLEYSQDPSERRELLERLAQLYEEQQENYVGALETTAKLLSEDLGDQRVLSELERLAKVAGAERRLAEIYSTELEKLAGDDDSSVKIARRAAEIFTDLNDLEQGLKYYRRALAFEPESRPLFDAIDAILVRTEQHAERAELYREALDHRFEPEDRLRALHTIAELERTKLGEVDKAIETYRSALDVEETDAVSLDALTELYRERKRFDDLGELYLRRAEGAANPNDGGKYRLALARLYNAELSSPERAVDQLEEIVRELPSHAEAIRELEAMKSNPDQRERVVQILQPLYESLDDWKRLIQLNQDRMDLADDPSEKVQVLRETATLWETRGSDPERARRALGLAFELDPEDSDVRSEYERLSTATAAWDELTTTYEHVLQEKPDVGAKRDILSVIARVHNERRDDPRKALEAYGRLHEVEPSELEPLEKMERLSTLLSDWSALVRVLTDKAELLLSDDERASVWRRVGEAKRDMLDDRDGAIEAYERAFELESTSAFTVDCLIDLYEQKGDAQRLVELYQSRVELTDADDTDQKYTLLVLAAKAHEEKLSDRGRAIELLVQALQVRPGDAEALSAVNRLYRTEERWSELLENLKLEAGTADTVERRAELRREIGTILSQRLENFEEALEAYRLVLEEVPTDAASVKAAKSLAQDHEDLRGRVAEILVPVLTQTAEHEQLVSVLELRLSVETTPSERAQTLRTMGELLETKLSRPKDAQAALLRALSDQPEAADLHSDIERLSEAAKQWPDYADALSERAGATFDPEIAKDLFMRLGRVAEEKLKDDQRAVQAYAKAVEQAGDQPDLLEALDRLYARTGDKQALADVLERRVGAEASDEAQADLYFRLAVLQIREFENVSQGMASLRSALERSSTHEGATRELERLTDQRDLFEEAAETLERVYRANGKTDKLASLYEKRVGFADTAQDRMDMRRNLARVLETDCADPAAAQRVLSQGLGDDPSDESLLEEIERLASITGKWENAAQALAEAIPAAPNLLPSSALALSVRLSGWYSDKISDPARAETALKQALEFDANDDNVLSLLERLQRQPGRERDLIETLRRRAKIQTDYGQRELFYQEAKNLADGLGEVALGEAVLRELLEQDESNLWALAALTEQREHAADYKETFALLVRQAELGGEASSVKALRRRAAEIAREKLSDASKAISLYEHLFEDDPDDRDAAAKLRALYADTKKFQELGRLLERLTDLADTASARSELRVELARLNKERFDSPESAIELLKIVLEEEPSRSEAVVFLSELYEETKRDEDLAELLASQISAAKQRGDVEAELTYEVRLGEVYDSRLGDRNKAIQTYQAVLERSAEHRGALDALARLYKAGDDHAGAASILEKLVSLSSGAEAVALSLSLSDEYAALKDGDNATRALERGLSADEQNAELRQRLRERYQAASAWEKLGALVAKDAEFASGAEQQVKLFVEAAKIYSGKSHDFATAATLLERASQLKPEDRALLLELCDAYSSSGRGKDAAAVLERIVESFGTKRSKELAEIHRRLADAYLAQGETQRGLDELDKAFRIEPGNVHILKRLGEVALEVNDTKKAMQMFRALLLQKLDAESPITKAQVFMRIGEVHEKLDEKPKAIQNVERAIQTDPNLTAAKEYLARLKG